MTRTNRLFGLISALRARRMPVTATDLARELDVSARTIYRDIESLRSLGAPVDGQPGFGYRLREGFFLPEFAFSPDEMDAVMLGLEWVRKRADPALAQSSDRALSKIWATKYPDAARSAGVPDLVAADSPPSSAAADPPQTAQLRDAIRRERKVSIRYVDSEGAASERTVWPIAVVYFDEVRVLVAWCERRSAFRHFRVDRVHVESVREERYPESRDALVARWREQDRWPNPGS